MRLAPPPLALLVTAAAMAAAWLVTRAVERRRRAAARSDAAQLASHVRHALAGALDPARVADEAAGLDAASFWTALESLDPPLRRRRAPVRIWRALGRAIARLPHVEDEVVALEVESPWRRALAARRLSFVHAPRARRALWAALRSEDESVRLAAARALGAHRDGRALAWVLDHPAAFARRSPRARTALLAGFGRGAAPRLAATLARGTSDPAMDRALIECLGMMGHAPARTLIEPRLRDPDLDVRVAAARALGRLCAEDCGASLVAALADPAWQVRALACWSLGHMRAGLGVVALPARLSDSAWWVRRHAAWALARLGEEGRAELAHVAGGSPDPYAREIARAALAGRLCEMGRRGA